MLIANYIMIRKNVILFATKTVKEREWTDNCFMPIA